MNRSDLNNGLPEGYCRSIFSRLAAEARAARIRQESRCGVPAPDDVARIARLSAERTEKASRSHSGTELIHDSAGYDNSRKGRI